jgi:ParB/RepB/Spo0J family partition protein
MRNRLTVASVDPAQIVIWEHIVVRDRRDQLADTHLSTSIKQSGIQQPVVLVSDGEKLILVDGVRRLRAAKALGIVRVPVAIDVLPEDQEAESYVRRMRFILDEHRQDLIPTQRAKLISQLKDERGFTNADLGQYLGCNEDSITNWLAVLKYIPEVQEAMDLDELSQAAARVFDGMSEKGQQHVWKEHRKELLNSAERSGIHQKLRALYSTESHPDFYRSARKLAAGFSNQKVKARRALELEKTKLSKSLKAKESELAELKAEVVQSKKDIEAAAPIVAALLRNENLRRLVPEEMLPELERFAEDHC